MHIILHSCQCAGVGQRPIFNHSLMLRTMINTQKRTQESVYKNTDTGDMKFEFQIPLHDFTILLCLLFAGSVSLFVESLSSLPECWPVQ